VVGEVKMSDEKKTGKISQGGAENGITESQRLERLKDVRAPIISEVIAENPGLTEEQLIQMMDEMGF
tara:strand:- start:293 stop:493 length:201 start_codon:yes stop_codon:yes gene_type:complete